MRRYSVALSAAFFLPNVVPGAAVAVIFATLLGTNGLLPGALHLIGVNINWLGSATWSKPSVILAGSWQWIGFWVIVLVAALRAVPDEYYDAAKVDGAGLFPRIWHVSLPTIRPALVFVLDREHDRYDAAVRCAISAVRGRRRWWPPQLGLHAGGSAL